MKLNSNVSESLRPAGCGGQRGFTVVELAVLLVTFTLLAMVAVPAICRTKPNNRVLQCLSNMRALGAAWQMYTQDNNDKIVTQIHGGTALGGAGDPTYGAPWLGGWLDWSTTPDNTNVLLVIAERYARLARYTRDAAVYRCPADNYLSPVQVSRGWKNRVRSYAGNVYVGDGNAESGPTDPIYRHVRKTTEMLYPAPASVWVFVEEHPDSINDGAVFSPHRTSWVDLPASLHSGATAFAFADGHGEIHAWAGSLARGRATQVTFMDDAVGIPAPVGDPDVRWISYRTPRNTSSSY